ncbi:pilus assembly protein [Methyloversatilis universalis]|uniref:pilus assembly protein n=1 Tax=Methyloversatilis universalis TaxID=378211 RepID=UPI00037F76CA|nr:PilC/PilY family type IV pilus protein [Methyloversatilis universalis]
MTHTRKFAGSARRRLHAALLVAFSTTLPVQAATDISNQPLVLNVTAAPNVLMILDNSGSMASETLPDDFFNEFSIDFVLKPASDTNEVVPDYDDLNILNVAGRSAWLNRVYYDPTVTYKPWTKADGTAYPASTPTAAPAAPGSTTLVDLTSQISRSFKWRKNTSVTTFSFSSSAITRNNACAGGADNCSMTFWPITYFVHKGTGSIYSRANYYRYRIQGTTAYRKDLADGTEVTVSSLTWSNGITRTVDQETRNFANWYTYGRTRMNSAKGGVSSAFSTLGQNYRVGFRTINGTSGWLSIPTTGTFSDTNRTNFFDKLFAASPSGLTPLRKSLLDAGEYFKTSAPWGPDVAGAPLGCRQAFTIMTTDGYYNSTSDRDITAVNSAIGNADRSKGRPYADTYSLTLADIAMHYYDTDLQSTIPDKVPTSGEDPNNRQHMNTFAVAFGLKGTLDPATDLPALTAGTKSWPDPTTNDTAKLDDLWHATVNGRGRFVSAADPTEFASGLKAALDTIVARTASSSNLGVSSAQLRQGSRVYQARFTSEVWTGDIWAFQVGSDGNIASTANWKASEQIPGPSARNIYTRNGTTAVDFTWSNLSDTQKAALGNSSAVLDYLRGVRTGEAAEGGTFRNRNLLIGDIVHSSPVFVGAPDNFGYERYSWDGASTYQDFRSLRANRTPMLYVNANDGMTHGFNANTGAEVFAYVPSSALAQMNTLTQPNYSHQFINDGSINVADVYDASGSAGVWRSLLFSSTGRGGRQLYALDVSDPTVPASGAAGARVKWEFSHSDFGRFTGRPVVARMNNGVWAVIVGNGYNSDQYKGYLFVINALTGALISTIDTGACATTDSPCLSNGLAEITTWDDDDDGDVDYVYAGDLRGNLWRFDMTSSVPSEWKASFGTAASPLPLFRAVDSAGTPQPITSRVEVMLDPSTGVRWVSFGTGQFLSTTDRTSHAVQSWYGMYDNYLTGAATSPVVGRTNLAERRVIKETTQTTGTGDTATTVSVRVISAPGDDVGGQAVTDADGAYIRKGWYLDLLPESRTAAGERMIYGVQAFGGALFATSAIPADDPCTPGGSGWLMGINPYTGGRLGADLFANRAQVTITSGETSSRYYVSAVSTGSMPSSPILVRNEGTGGTTTGGSTGNSGNTGTDTGGSTGGSTGSNSSGGVVGRSDALVNTSDLGILRERLNLPDRFGRISWRELISD